MRTYTGRRILAERIEESSFANELVSLAIATRSISAKVYREKGGSGRLIDIARLLASLAPLYTHNSDGSKVRRLADEELCAGYFRKDGAELHFTDGRPAIINIAARHRAIEEATGILAPPREQRSSAVYPLSAGRASRTASRS